MVLSEQVLKESLTTEVTKWLLEHFLNRMVELLEVGDLPRACACSQLAAIVVEVLQEEGGF